MYHFIYANTKSRDERVKLIEKELIALWNKLNFPILSSQCVIGRINKLLKDCENNRKYQKQQFDEEIEKVFDITKVDGFWFCAEDKKLYELQITSNAKQGYVTNKIADKSSIHPSKRSLLNIKTSKKINASPADDNFSGSASSNSSEDEDYVLNHPPCNDKKRKYCSTHISSNLVTKLSLSTNKASKVCEEFSKSGVNVPTPTQSSVFKAVIKYGESQAEIIKEYLKNNKNFCLHFDGKRLPSGSKAKNQYDEYQVVCLQNSNTEIKLGIAKCVNGSAEGIFDGISNILNSFDAWSAIKMIVCDTTAVNTGSKSGVVVKIKEKMASMRLNIPQYVGCQHHVLDRILRHVLDFYLCENIVGLKNFQSLVSFLLGCLVLSNIKYFARLNFG